MFEYGVSNDGTTLVYFERPGGHLYIWRLGTWFAVSLTGRFPYAVNDGRTREVRRGGWAVYVVYPSAVSATQLNVTPFRVQLDDGDDDDDDGGKFKT